MVVNSKITTKSIIEDAFTILVWTNQDREYGMGIGPFPTTVGIWYRHGTLVVWEWDIFLYLFGVKVVAILSMCVPVLDADGGSPLVAADLRDGVIPQP